MTRSKLLLAGVAAALGCSSASAKDDYIYGPAPDWARYRQLGEAAVRAALPDPANWQVEWPNAYVKRAWNHKGSFPGYATCGVLRATAPASGHSPVTDFVIVIDHDAVKTLEISKSNSSIVAVVCHSLVQQGVIPLASTMATAAAPAPSELPVATLGLTIRPMPEGAYVISVASGSPAAQAKLVPGTVITRANGIALAGMGDAMAKLLGADTPTLSLDTAAGGHVEIRR